MRDSVFTNIMQEKFQCAGVEEKGQNIWARKQRVQLQNLMD